jgi:multidrug resistance protein, MATE family
MTTLIQRCRAEVAGLVNLAVPLVAGLTASSLLMITDTWMLGPLGAVPLAAASLTGSVILILWAALYGFMAPVGILVARAFGAGNDARVASVVAHGRWLGIGIGLASTLVMVALLPLLSFAGQPGEVLAVIGPYWITMALAMIPYSINLVFKQLLDAIDRPWTGVAIMFVAVVVNVPLNFALIHGAWVFPRLGLTGAAVATLVSEGFTLAAFYGYWRCAPAMAGLRRAVRLHRAGFAEQSRVGVPVGFQYLAEGGALAVAGVMIGLLGATALAANQIVLSVASVLYMLPLGMAGAVGIRIGQALGAGETARVQPIGLTAMGLVTLWTLMFTAVLVFAGEDIASAFISDRAVTGVATMMFVAVGFMQVFDGIQSVSLGALRALRDNRWPTAVTLGAYWLLALPLGWLLAVPLRFGAAGFWGGFALGLAVAALLLSTRFLRAGRGLSAAPAMP